MAVEIYFKKWNKWWMSGLFVFGTVKNSPGFVRIGPKSSICCVLELLK